MSQSLYDKYGGFAVISRVVMDFYDRLLDSDTVGPFFDDVDMRKLIDHQTKFVAYLLGGPAEYTGDRLQQLHAHLEIADTDFDEMKQLLDQTLGDHRSRTGQNLDGNAAVVLRLRSRRHCKGRGNAQPKC